MLVGEDAVGVRLVVEPLAQALVQTRPLEGRLLKSEVRCDFLSDLVGGWRKGAVGGRGGVGSRVWAGAWREAKTRRTISASGRSKEARRAMQTTGRGDEAEGRRGAGLDGLRKVPFKPVGWRVPN